jgi:hypothetical protein
MVDCYSYLKWQWIVYSLRRNLLSRPDFYRTKLYTSILVTRRFSYKKQILLTLREHRFYGGSVLLIFLVLLCCPIMCLYVLSSVLSIMISHKKACSVRLCFQLFVWGLISYLRFCVCLRIVVSNTCCVVFLFCLSWSCVPYVASFSGLSIFDCPFGVL